MWTYFKFQPIKTFPENCELIRVWLWLAYRFTENNCHFTTFLQVYSNSKEVPYISYLLLQNEYPNLRITYYINQTNIFLVNYTPKETICKISYTVISVAATLIMVKLEKK